MPSLPAELMGAVDMDKVIREANEHGESELAREEGDMQDGGSVPFLARDYIPTDPKEQTPEQRAYLQMGGRPSERSGPSDFIPTAPAVVDRTPDEKRRVAEEAAKRWEERYEGRVRAQAERHVRDMSEASLISYMETLGLTDRNIYLEVEQVNQNREAIFNRFGQPVGDTRTDIEPQKPAAIPAEFEGPEPEKEDE